jgi:PRTRC genetic system protein E
MFESLTKVSTKGKVTVTVETVDGEMNVIVFIDLKDKADKSLNVAPFRVAGKPEQMNQLFDLALKEFTSKNLSSIERIALVTKTVKAAEKKVAASATDKKSSKTTSTAKKEPEKKKEEPDMFTGVSERKQIKASHAKGKSADGKATVTGTLTAKEVSKEEQEVIEKSMSMDMVPLDDNNAALKAKGEHFLNKAGELKKVKPEATEKVGDLSISAEDMEKLDEPDPMPDAPVEQATPTAEQTPSMAPPPPTPPALDLGELAPPQEVTLEERFNKTIKEAAELGFTGVDKITFAQNNTEEKIGQLEKIVSDYKAKLA